MRLRLPDPSSARRLAAFWAAWDRDRRTAPDVLEVRGDVDRGELAIYLRVWGVLHPEAAARLEE